MGPDPCDKLECGDLGTVISIDDAEQVHISWDKGAVWHWRIRLTDANA